MPSKDMDTEKSRSQKKRESTALQQLGEQLAALSPAAIRKLQLPDDVKEALTEHHTIKTHEGCRRHMQYIGRILRELTDPESVLAALGPSMQTNRATTAELHRIETLRDALLNDDEAQRDIAFRALLAEHPSLDTKKLTHLVEGALAERRKQRPPKNQRELFRYLRTIEPVSQ